MQRTSKTQLKACLIDYVDFKHLTSFSNRRIIMLVDFYEFLKVYIYPHNLSNVWDILCISVIFVFLFVRCYYSTLYCKFSRLLFT